MAPAVPGAVELEEATVAMLRKACKDGVVNDLTVRMVRQELEQQFSLAPGTLDANEHKATIKAAVLTNLDEIRASMDARQSLELAAKKKPDHTVSPSKKRGSDRKEQKGASKRTRKAKVVVSSAEESETEARKERKSREVPSGFPKKSKSQAKPEINGSKLVVESNSKLKSKEGSELSSVVDEPPKKKRKKQGESDSRTSKRGKKSKEPLPKDEATVGKLKAIIVACGLRKVWKKEFQGLQQPKQQIKRLHEILAELGMTPRYTMEKAREIRKKREFERELQDVKEFEEALREKDRRKQASGSGSDSDEPSNSDGVPVKKKAIIHSLITPSTS
ncbi:hypothetical protein EDD15DRAFT_2423618 [Pisolithus albus]|nr:hypothetical protein EDD15DRAFT_2423618 [Pisolithus albus]